MGGLSEAAKANIMYLGVALGVLVLVVLLSIWGAAGAAETARPSKHFDARLRELVQEAGRWSAASARDDNPLLAVKNAAHSVAILNVARSLASDADVERAANLRLNEFAQALEDAQAAADARVAAACPALAVPGLSALRTGWLASSPA